ncbi:MAG: hypothetical protein QOG66_1684 [Methylobacteriaceae bacterium]|jgi:uncharacterized repeat protein (TIGR01451 family)|nr:hypothetical protein [Methylobacteriaceae bacterium]
MRQFLPHVFVLAFAAAAASPGFAQQEASKEPAADKKAILKVCKVGGPGIQGGMPFTVTAGSMTKSVPSGSAPGGNCVLVGTDFEIGKDVAVTETIPDGHTVSSIVVAPADRQVKDSLNLRGGTVSVKVGTGVTVVTFTDKRTGFVEICKTGDVTGNFSFTVNPGSFGPFSVPAGACTPSIEVAAGAVVIHEQSSGGYAMSGCSTLPAAHQGACNMAAQTSTVNVDPGDVSTETIAFIENTKKKYAASLQKRFTKSDAADRGTFVISVKNDGDAIPAGTPIIVTDTLPAGTTFVGLGGNSGASWNCTPAFPVTAPATLTCKYTGSYPINSAASLPDLVLNATFASGTDGAKNCAAVAVNGSAIANSNGGQTQCPF